LTGFTTGDPAFASVLGVAERVARSQASVLVLGESGTGKNRMARFLHERSPRASGPFVEIPCANVATELFESDLFGHEPGAFTDARVTKIGRLEQAHGGTLFLDEIGELDIAAQGKLLRALEERSFERVGGHATLSVDVRIVASSRERPEKLVAEGRLRDDLLYRLDVIRIELPTLRARVTDVLALAASLLEETIARHGLEPRAFSPEAARRLSAHAWPGNVRELRHVVERAAILAQGATIEPEDLPAGFSQASPAMLAEAAARGATLEEVERAYIDEVLRLTRGNKTAAARILGIHRKTLHEKLRGAGGGDPES
jgi:two-component system response regulator HydG